MLLWGVAIWGSDFWAAPQLGYAGLTPKFWALTDTANLRKWPVTGFCDPTIYPGCDVVKSLKSILGVSINLGSKKNVPLPVPQLRW